MLICASLIMKTQVIRKIILPATLLKLLQQVVIVLPKATNFTFQTSNTFRNYMIPEVSVVFVTSFVTTFQRYKVTVLRLLDRELYCLKLTRDYVTTLTNYKGWVTTKVGSTILINYRGCVSSNFRGNEHFSLSNFKGRVHFTRSYYSFTTIGSYNSPRLRNKIRRSTSVISQDYSSWIKLLPETFSLTTSSWM